MSEVLQERTSKSWPWSSEQYVSFHTWFIAFVIVSYWVAISFGIAIVSRVVAFFPSLEMIFLQFLGRWVSPLLPSSTNLVVRYKLASSVHAMLHNCTKQPKQAQVNYNTIQFVTNAERAHAIGVIRLAIKRKQAHSCVFGHLQLTPEGLEAPC